MQACGVVNDHLERVLGARPGRARASRLMLDERVLAVLRRLEDEDARDDASSPAGAGAVARDRAVERCAPVRARRRPGRVRAAGDRRLARLLGPLARRRRTPCRRSRSRRSRPSRRSSAADRERRRRRPRRLGRRSCPERVRDAAGARRRLAASIFLDASKEDYERCSVSSASPARRQRRGRRQRGLAP